VGVPPAHTHCCYLKFQKHTLPLCFHLNSLAPNEHVDFTQLIIHLLRADVRI
jgi:hypothetical protein